MDKNNKPVTTDVPIDSEEAKPFIEDVLKGKKLGYPDPPKNALPPSSKSKGYPKEGWSEK